MEKKLRITKILGIAGTVLSWFPLLAPVVFSFFAILSRHRFLFDYLMPAELFPAALAGSLLLMWAALRAHTYGRLIGWSFGTLVIMLAGLMVIPVVTGLASGETEPGGWQWAVVIVILVVYTAALVVIAVGGVLLLGKLFRSKPPAA